MGEEGDIVSRWRRHERIFFLLILKRLMSLVGEIEQGLRMSNNQNEPLHFYNPNVSSDDCPWDPYPRPLPPTPIDDENEDLAQSVRECLTSKQGDNFKIHHYFDYIAGTSTGGLSAIMLGRLEMSVQKALEQYDLVGKEVFGRPRFVHSSMGFANFIRPKYPSKNMEEAMISVIQNGLADQPLYKQQSDDHKKKYAASLPFHSDPRRCRTIVLAHGPSDMNKEVKHTYVFRTFDHPQPSPWAPNMRRRGHRNPGSATSDKVWKVARATSAAPKYFSPIRFNDRTFLDGGLGANNPAEVALAEVRQMHRHLPQILLSVGTGLQDKKKHSAKNYTKLALAKGWRHVGKAMTYLVTQSEDTHERVFETCARESISYHRWNVNGVGDVVLDEWDPPSTGETTKKKIVDLTQTYLSRADVNKRLIQYAKRLVEIRRRRARTERWEVFARQNVYFCPEPECHNSIAAQSFETREELREHGICKHSYITNVNVKNVARLNHACIHNECGHESIHVFPEQEEFKQHLQTDHSVRPDPVFMTPRRMEAWLDNGRMTQLQALARHDSEEPLENAPNSTTGANGVLPPQANGVHHPTRSTENGVSNNAPQPSTLRAASISPARVVEEDTTAGVSQESEGRG